MRKKILCFSSEQTLQGSFFMQMKKAVWFRYEIITSRTFREIECYFIPDLRCGSETRFLCRYLLSVKKRLFIKRYKKSRKGQPVTVSSYEAADRSDYPPDVRMLCAGEFLGSIPYQKNTVIGILDGEALDRKIWVKILRKKLDCINGLMIVSNRPECFMEFCRDAWEQQGLIVTVTENERELQFCDFVMDCSRNMTAEKYVFRRPCEYFMIYENKRKKKRLKSRNQGLKFTVCGDFVQKM